MKRYAKILLGSFLLPLLYHPVELPAEPYYQGKVLTIVVGYGPGGGYDRSARLMAKHLPRFIPGSPAVIVENQGGAASMIATNYLYKMAKPDGLTIGVFNRSLPIAQLVKAQGVKFDLTQFSWIGSVASEGHVLTLQSNLPYKTFAELLKSKAKVNLGTVGPSDTIHQFCSMLKMHAGLNANLIVYPSTTDIMLAIERKELEGRSGAYSSLRPHLARGVVRCVLRGRVSKPGIEELPVDEDFALDKKGKSLMALRSATDRIGIPFVAPPKTPPAVISILHDAFTKALNDPQLKTDADKLMMDADYIPADDVLKIVREILSAPEDVVQDLTKIVKF
jgi:tripartite-type tricarboxylate transporter receptor subunit TctC